MSIASKLKELEISAWHTAVSGSLAAILTLISCVLLFIKLYTIGYNAFLAILISILAFYVIFQVANILVLLIDRLLLEIRRFL